MYRRQDHLCRAAGSEDRLPYEAPRLELFTCYPPKSLLETVSVEGEVHDFEDGDDF